MEKTKRIIYYRTTLWNKIEQTEETQEVFSLLQKFCHDNSMSVLSYNVVEGGQMPQPDQEVE